MSDLSDKMVAGLEELGSLAMSLEMAAIQGSLPADVRQQLAALATDIANRTDELRTLAKQIP